MIHNEEHGHPGEHFSYENKSLLFHDLFSGGKVRADETVQENSGVKAEVSIG